MSVVWLIVAIIVILWLGGFAMHIGGNLIHILLVVAAVIIIIRLIRGERI